MNVAAKADHVAKAQARQIGEQLLITEATIGQDGDAAAGGHEFGQPPQAGILEIVALVLRKRDFRHARRKPPLPGWPITIRGGGDPSQNMVIEPFVRMGPPPRSLAAEANDCFMVRP